MTHLIQRMAHLVQGQANGRGNRVETLTGRVQPDAPPLLAPTFVKDILDTRDRTPERKRVGLEGYIHVSSLIGFCPRQHALLRRHDSGQPHFTVPHGGDRVMWAIGRAVEHHIRQQIIADRRQDVFGIWECPCGDTRHAGFFPDRMCQSCRKRLTVYREHPLADHDAKVVGNPDIILRERGWMVPVEIKSMAKGQWDKITATKGDHVFQAGWYNYLLRKLGFRTHPQARVIYAAKDYAFGSPYKEFFFDATKRELVAQVEASRQVAMLAHAAAEDDGALPGRLPSCASCTTGTAKACPALVSCFSLP